MRIHIEDYFGNDVIKLAFCLKDNNVSEHQERVDNVNNIAIEYGYSVADIDEDEQGEYIRVQQIHVVDDEVGGEEEQVQLILFMSTLTAEYI